MSDEIKWITIKGTHIPILPGKSEQEAINSFLEAIEHSNEAKRTSTKKLKERLTISLDDNPKLKTKNAKPRKNRNQPTISQDHYSRLRIMWSDYHLGTCKPVEKNGVKYFNVDNTIYFTVGEYPNFKIINVRTFKNTFYLEKYLKGF